MYSASKYYRIQKKGNDIIISKKNLHFTDGTMNDR